MILPHLTRLSSVVALCVATAAFYSASAQAASLSSWTSNAGSHNSNLNTNSPVMGDGTASSGSNSQIYAAFETQSLANVGESLTLSGSVAFTGIGTPQSDQFRFGIFDSNDSSNANGWLGYFATNSGTPAGGTGPSAGRLWERDAGNTGSFGSGSGASQIKTVNATPANNAFVDGTYDLSMVFTRTDTGLEVSWSLISSTYTLSGSYLDTTPLTYDFDRVGFFSGGGLPASEIAFSDLDIKFVPAIPEPESSALIGAILVLGIAMIMRRRRRG